MTNSTQDREAFEKACGRGYDYTLEPDAWTRPRYKMTHIEAMFQGWLLYARAQPEPAAGDAVELLEEAFLWIRELREGVNKWCDPMEYCGVHARLENLESWANRARAAISALAAPSVVSEDEAVEIMMRAYRAHEGSTLLQPIDRCRKAYRALVAAGVINGGGK